MKPRQLQSFIAIALIAAVVLIAGCASLSSNVEKSASPSIQYAGESPAYAPMPATSDSYGRASGSGSTTFYAPSTPNAYSDVANRKVIMTAYLQIETDKLDAATDRIRGLALGAGGYVQSSSLDVFSNNRRTCTISIKVPQASFESTLAEIRKLGTVKADRSSGSDVTSQYVDLTARLKNSKAEESRLLDIMAQANNTADILAVERELSRVQGEIESQTGQLNLLNNQIDFSTITVYVAEPEPVVAYDWGLGTALSEAIHGFIGMIGGLIVVTGYLVPLAIYLALCILVLYAAAKIVIWLSHRRSRQKQKTEEQKKQ